MNDTLADALAKRVNDITTFVWKGKKSEKDGQLAQNEVKMVDCTVEELRKFYEHCESMLHSENSDNPGRYTLLEIISDQKDKCNTELFIRWLEQEKDIKRFVFLNSLGTFLDKNPDLDRKTTTIDVAVGECPREFANLPIETVLSGCLDTLGRFNKQHITLTFLLKQGLWFSPEESKKMARENVTDKLEYARKQLELRATTNLRISSKGLSLAQMHAMVSLRSKKYSELSTLQLETLRNRILFSLENEVRFHIQQWENREKQIKLVLKSKGIEI